MEGVKERQALGDLIQELKLGLISRATGKGMDPGRYREIRRVLLGIPNLQSQIPTFLRTCGSPDDFWSFIQPEFASYQERRHFISKSFQPLADAVDGIASISEAELAIGDVIGRGGFGTVYKAHHSVLDMDFAIKVFEPAFDDGAAAPLERFFREARILLMLNHVNIVRVFDAGLFKSKPFIRMELLEGKNLSEFLRDHGAMPLLKAATLVRKILEALSHAHGDAKVCHRDLKPSNVMVAGERVKIVDFGMGAFVEQELVSRLTRTGEHLVGGYFSAPELVQNPKVIDARADIYSVGAIWYNVITGRPPAGTDLVEQLKAVPKMTDRYRVAVTTALSAVEKRFQSAAEMLAEVQVIEKQWSTEGLIGWFGRE